MQLEYVDCPLCSHNNPVELFAGIDRDLPCPGSFSVVQCRDCGLVYLNPRPAEISLVECYPDAYDSYAFGTGLVGNLQKQMRRCSAMQLAGIFAPGGSILEIGCASGDLLQPLRDVTRFQVVGIELSSYAAKLAHAQGLDVRVGRLSDVEFDKESFDGVIMRNVLEHLSAPLEDLKRVAALLKPGGKIFIAIPNHDGLDRMVFGKYWYAYETPRHLTVPSVVTAKKMLAMAGFEIVAVRHSMVPNNWISSVRFLAEDLFDKPRRLKWINYKNPLLLFLALPLGILQKLLRMSGRIDIVARKPA